MSAEKTKERQADWWFESWLGVLVYPLERVRRKGLAIRLFGTAVYLFWFALTLPVTFVLLFAALIVLFLDDLKT